LHEENVFAALEFPAAAPEMFPAEGVKRAPHLSQTFAPSFNSFPQLLQNITFQSPFQKFDNQNKLY